MSEREPSVAPESEPSSALKELLSIRKEISDADVEEFSQKLSPEKKEIFDNEPTEKKKTIVALDRLTDEQRGEIIATEEQTANTPEMGGSLRNLINLRQYLKSPHLSD